MSDEQVYYVSLVDKKVSEQPMEEEATLEIVAKPEDIKKIKEYMHKNEDESVGDGYEEDLKTLFQLVYDLGTKETKESLGKILQ